MVYVNLLWNYPSKFQLRVSPCYLLCVRWYQIKLNFSRQLWCKKRSTSAGVYDPRTRHTPSLSSSAVKGKENEDNARSVPHQSGNFKVLKCLPSTGMEGKRRREHQAASCIWADNGTGPAGIVQLSRWGRDTVSPLPHMLTPERYAKRPY